jgi:hypothetical protein
MPVVPAVDSAPESGLQIDSWFLRALSRRADEINGSEVVTGARFNSFI